jgi:hypothetical protein
MLTRKMDPIPERMPTGSQSMSHASTRVSHGEYVSGDAAPNPPPGGAGA